MNFAPCTPVLPVLSTKTAHMLTSAADQSSPPESERAKSPPLRSPAGSPEPQAQAQRNISSIAAARAQRLPSPSQFADEDAPTGYTDLEGGPRQNDYIGSTALRDAAVGGSVFETSLGMPLRIEACLAYLLLPPAGGVVLLLFEHKSDYVRFHAWQSAMVFSAMFVLHIIFSWTKVVSWLLFVGDLALIGYLSLCAFRNAETLDRVEVPILGRLASGFIDDE